MADLKTDSTSQQNSCQSSREDVSNELQEKEQAGLAAVECNVIKCSDSSSKENPSSQSQPSPSKGCQSPLNSNPANAWPYFGSCAPGNASLSSFRDSRSLLGRAPSKFSSSASSGSGLNASSLSSSKPVLRPSQLLGSSSSFGASHVLPSSPFHSKGAYSLNPSRLGNPFAKVSAESKVEVCVEDEAEVQPKEKSAGEVTPKQSGDSVVAPKFVPLGKRESGSVERTEIGSSPQTPAASIPSHPSTSPEAAAQTSFGAIASHSTISAPSPSPGFVFGQNLHERVEASPSEACAAGSSVAVNGVSAADAPESKAQPLASVSFGFSNEGKCEAAATNGDSEMLFSSVLKRETNLDRLSSDGGESGHSKSLSEAAREYEESRAVKRKYEEVTIITGEEDEDNVLQITCKLFAFNIEKSSWVERGRGQLRVNDKSDPEKHRKKQSRLVMRTQGSLRVVLNTKIWAGMSVVQASPKSIRLTAMDDNQIRVFLIMASPADTDRLLQILVTRVELQKQLEESSKTGKEDDSLAKCSTEVPSLAKKVCEEGSKRIGAEGASSRRMSAREDGGGNAASGKEETMVHSGMEGPSKAGQSTDNEKDCSSKAM